VFLDGDSTYSILRGPHLVDLGLELGLSCGVAMLGTMWPSVLGLLVQSVGGWLAGSWVSGKELWHSKKKKSL
jgi:hypothetical protein